MKGRRATWHFSFANYYLLLQVPRLTSAFSHVTPKKKNNQSQKISKQTNQQRKAISTSNSSQGIFRRDNAVSIQFSLRTKALLSAETDRRGFRTVTHRWLSGRCHTALATTTAVERKCRRTFPSIPPNNNSIFLTSQLSWRFMRIWQMSIRINYSCFGADNINKAFSLRK